MTVSLIVAVAENGVIGSNNRIPWHVPADLKHFQETTAGHPVVMGRKTWESLGRPLKNRTNIVVSRTLEDQKAPGAIVCHSLRSAFSYGSAIAVDTFLIGGAQLYKEALEEDLVDRMILSKIPLSPAGDIVFPNYDNSNWNEVGREQREGFEIVWLDRKS